MKHKIFRVLLSLVLVCVLLISWSPIRARATSAGATAGIITQVLPLAGEGGAVAGGATLGTAVFGYVLAGLGVIIVGAALLEVVDRYQEYSGELETSIYYYPDGSWSYGVDMGFVDRVRAFVFDAGYVVSLAPSRDFDTHDFPEGSRWPTVINAVSSAGESAALFKVDKGTSFYYILCRCEKGVISISIPTGTYYNIKCSCGSFYVTRGSDTGNNIETFKGYETNTNIANTTLWHISGDIDANLGVSAGDGTEIAEVAAPFVDIPVGYPKWYTNARPATNPGTQEEITVLPIPLSPSADPGTQTDGKTQTDVWEGSISDSPPDVGIAPDVVPGTIGLSDIWMMIKSIPGALADVITGPIVGTLTDIWNFIKTIPGALADVITGPIVGTLTDIWDFIKTIPGSLADVITGPIVGALTNIWDLITSIPQAIAEAISAIFVPDADFITEKWNAIRSRFAFADAIASSGEMILGVLQGIDPEPPVIYVELGDAEGSYYLGGQVAFLDLRWYARYKPTGDAIISAFLWMVFVWRMFIKLPGIIAGLPGDFVMQGVIDLGLADRLPARKKEFENERQENRRFFKK